MHEHFKIIYWLQWGLIIFYFISVGYITTTLNKTVDECEAIYKKFIK